MSSFGGSWRSILKLTDYINTNGGHNKGRTIHIMHYGPNNYLTWYFSDTTNN